MPKPIQPSFEYVSPDLLDFDPSNPRFAGKMTKFNQSKIQAAIYDEPYYASELVDSLLENGFIDYEPLVVKRDGTRFIVVEGNRRLAAIREILGHPEKYIHGKISDLKKIPVLIFPEHPDQNQENEMRVYLGVRHLLGFREWPPFSKAEFLELESKKSGGLAQVLKETRLTKTAAKRFLIPYRILKKANEKIPDGEDFSNLSEAMGRAGTSTFIELEIDPTTLEIISFDKKKFAQLLDDLYGKKSKGQRDAATKVVSDTREISLYAKVLNSKAASTVLHSGKSLSEAEIYVDTREESLRRLIKVSKQIGSLLKKIQVGKKTPDDVAIMTSYKAFEEEVKQYVAKKQ